MSVPEAALNAARSAFARVARHAVRAAFRAIFRMRLEGEPPRRGGYILAANHQGWADAFVLLALFPPAPRLVFLGDERALTHVWWKRAVMALFGGVIRIDRTRSTDPSAIEAALAVLGRGEVLVVFPEGRVSHREDALAPFHRGVGYLSLKTRAPILPVHLSGTAELYLGRPLVARVGSLRQPPAAAPAKDASASLAAAVHADVAMLAPVSRDPVPERKRLRWLTDLL
jgi:1-acyl-sn-glycerol-3-phosphate acyltransferase